jgi:hypothetical protein
LCADCFKVVLVGLNYKEGLWFPRLHNLIVGSVRVFIICFESLILWITFLFSAAILVPRGPINLAAVRLSVTISSFALKNVMQSTALENQWTRKLLPGFYWLRSIFLILILKVFFVKNRFHLLKYKLIYKNKLMNYYCKSKTASSFNKHALYTTG